MTTKTNAFDGQGTNFMTPKIIERQEQGNVAWEISEGTGFDEEPIFGLTFMVRPNGYWIEAWREADAPVSRLFYSEQQARDYLEEVLA